MKADEMTKKDKVTLLANADARGIFPRNEEFEKVMAETLPPDPIQIADPIRQALVTYIREQLSLMESDIAANPKEFETYAATGLMLAWLHGYQVALKWGKSIEKTSEGKVR